MTETTRQPEALLRVCNLQTHFRTPGGMVRAVDGLSFRVETGRTFALVGESGCGKSATGCSILRLIPDPPGRIAGGRILLDGTDLLALREADMRKVRGGQIGMVFQEPMTSLNPVFTCGDQIVEAIQLHSRRRGREARQLAEELLAKVGIPEPRQRMREYPHQLSGGMRQRVMIAMALSCEPRLLIADEPTTALDVTIQAQILDLLREIQTRARLSVLLITHDLAVVAEAAHAVGVMYAGRLVELADVGDLFAAPLHPYTQGLFRCLPRLGDQRRRLETIPGSAADPLQLPTGCPFHPRCGLGRNNPRCRTQPPALRQVAPGHWSACWQCAGYDHAPETDPATGPLAASQGDPHVS